MAFACQTLLLRRALRPTVRRVHRDLLNKQVLSSSAKHLFETSVSGDDGARKISSLQRLIIIKRTLHATAVHLNTVSQILSDIGEGIREVAIKEWFVKEGDHVQQFDQLCEVQSDKASVTITSRFDGVVGKLHYQLNDTAYVGSPLVDIKLDKSAEVKQQVDDVDGKSITPRHDTDSDSDHEQVVPPPRVPEKRPEATPAVRRVAMENKVSLHEVIGTGKDGRILKEDVFEYIKTRGVTPSVTAQPSQPPGGQKVAPSPPACQHSAQPKPAREERQDSAVSHSQTDTQSEDRVVPLRGIRKAMAKAMTEALKIPHFGYCDEVDMSELVRLRKQLKGASILQNMPFSYMPVIIKASSLALRDFPILNSSLHPSGDKIIMKSAHNIGFAMDSPEGLIVPNVKNVQNLSILGIAKELQRLISLGEAGRLGQGDITGGTFTLSNIGSIGGTYAKPVILSPEVAIGALGKIQKLPRFDENDNVVKAHIMQVSWSADHRIIEGAQMARFSNLWKSYLENPAWLILHLK